MPEAYARLKKRLSEVHAVGTSKALVDASSVGGTNMEKTVHEVEAKQQLDDLFNEWVKRDTAEVRAEYLGGKATLKKLKLQAWAQEPHNQMAELLDFYPQFKAEYGEKARQHLISVGVRLM
jgi:hypothetical protein